MLMQCVTATRFQHVTPCIRMSRAHGIQPKLKWQRNTSGRRYATSTRAQPSSSIPSITPELQTTKPTRPQSPPNSGFPASRAIPLFLGSLLAGGIAFYIAQLAVAARRPCTNPAASDLAAQKDVSARYDDTADGFDAEVGLSETLMGINRIRRRLAQQCHGHVLEVSCGTGRNLGYFDLGPNGKVDSLTFVDLSPSMVDMCRKKWDVLFGGLKGVKKEEKLKKGLIVRFMHGSALGQMPTAPTEDGRYDTVVQTMGLCSTPQPTELVANMTRYLDMENDNSRILLLEHGRSYKSWLNNILDSSAEKHAEIHGCWFNRDIGQLVQEAAEMSGLEVVRERRHHFGTTWVYELKPKRNYKQLQNISKRVQDQGQLQTTSATTTPTWTSWLSGK